MPRDLIVFAVALAVPIPALRLYLKSHPPDVSPAGVQSLLRGLRIGTISSTALPLLFILNYFHPFAFRANLLFFLLALAGNGINLAALVDCLRELSGESLFAGLLLILYQLLWLWWGLMALLSAS
jgi:hypothetical protein